MKIDSIGELKKLIAMLQNQGVEICKVDGIELVLRPLPEKTKRSSKAPAKSFIDSFGEVNEGTSIPAPSNVPRNEIPDSFEALTDEQKLFYSSAQGGIPTQAGDN